jgi:integrase
MAHLLGVASLVLGETGHVPFPVTEDMAIAALLHDAVEDEGGLPRLRDIEAKFGNKRNDAQSFFARKDGEAIHHQMLLRTFESVRRRADVTRLDGIGRKPLLRELRPTFAVYCLREWIERKKDLRSMLPILAAYMGHVSLSSTEEYLSFAPNRFWKQLSSLSPGAQGASGCL